jgi:hypothetical protein
MKETFWLDDYVYKIIILWWDQWNRWTDEIGLWRRSDYTKPFVSHDSIQLLIQENCWTNGSS